MIHVTIPRRTEGRRDLAGGFQEANVTIPQTKQYKNDDKEIEESTEGPCMIRSHGVNEYEWRTDNNKKELQSQARS